MTDDHVFIDMVNARIEGKLNNRKMAWEPFFRLFPSYHNIFEKILVKGSTVILQGYAVCSDEVLNNVRAIWIAGNNQRQSQPMAYLSGYGAEQGEMGTLRII